MRSLRPQSHVERETLTPLVEKFLKEKGEITVIPTQHHQGLAKVTPKQWNKDPYT